MKKACIMDIDGTLFLDFKKVYLDIMKSILDYAWWSPQQIREVGTTSWFLLV